MEDAISTGSVSSLSEAGDDDHDDDSDDDGTKDSNTDGEEEEKQYFNYDENDRRIEISFTSPSTPREQQQQDIIANNEEDEEELIIEEPQTGTEESFEDNLEREEEYRVLLNDADDNVDSETVDYDEIVMKNDKDRYEEYSIDSVDEATVGEEEIIEIEVSIDDNEEREEEIEEVILDDNEEEEIEEVVLEDDEDGGEEIEEVVLEDDDLAMMWPTPPYLAERNVVRPDWLP